MNLFIVTRRDRIARPPRICAGISALALGAALAAQAPLQQRSYHLGALLAPPPTGPYDFDDDEMKLALPVRLPLNVAVHADSDEPPDLLVSEFPTPRLSSSRLSELLARTWEDRAEPGPEPRSSLQGPRLYLSAPAAVHTEVAHLLAALGSGLRQRFELTIHLLPNGAAVESHQAVLDSEATDQLLRQHAPTASHRSVLNADVARLVRNGRLSSVLLDYDVEVAQESAIADLKVDKLFDGFRAGVIATQLADGRVFVQTGLRLSELERPIRERTLEGKGLGNVHQPRIHSQILTGTGVLEDGGAMLLGGRSKNGMAYVLRVRRLVGRDPGDTGDVELIPLGFLQQPHLRLARDSGLRPPYRNGEDRSAFDTEAPQAERGDLEELLDQILEGRLADRAVRYDFVGSYLLVRGPAAERERVRSAVRSLAERAGAVTLQYRIGTVPTDSTQSFMQGRLTAGELAAMLATRGVIATVPGHDFRIVDGIEETSVRDYDVEIAQASAVVNPVMDTLFSGTAFSGRLARAHDGTLECAGNFYYAAEPTSVRLASKVEEIGDLDATETLFSQEDLSVALTGRREWQVLHLQPLRGAKESAVLMVRVQ